MDIYILKYFLAVAYEESITKAAKVLHTTQRNFSRQLTELSSFDDVISSILRNSAIYYS
jgi:DNA-binding transcriptional LysR family regulator